MSWPTRTIPAMPRRTRRTKSARFSNATSTGREGSSPGGFMPRISAQTRSWRNSRTLCSENAPIAGGVPSIAQWAWISPCSTGWPGVCSFPSALCPRVSPSSARTSGRSETRWESFLRITSKLSNGSPTNWRMSSKTPRHASRSIKPMPRSFTRSIPGR